MTKKHKKIDDYQPATEKDKLAFLILSIWGLCVPLLFITMNRNLYKNALSGTLLWLHWTFLIVLMVLWQFLWKKKQVVKPLFFGTLAGLLVFVAVYVMVKPNITYYDALVMTQNQHPEIKVQAYVTDDELQLDATKIYYYVKPSPKEYNPFLKMDYMVYGIDITSNEIKSFRVSPRK